MTMFINQAVLNTVNMKSDALGVLDSIAHPFQYPGQYQGQVMVGKTMVARFVIDIRAEGNGEQVTVNLDEVTKNKKVTRLTGGKADGKVPVYALFHATSARDYHVIIKGSDGKSVVFDSRKLDTGDIYIVMPVQPGDYDIGDGKKSLAKLNVAQAKPGDKAQIMERGAALKVTKEGIKGGTIKIMSGQPVTFEMERKGAVHLSLSGKKSPKKDWKQQKAPDAIKRPLSRVVGKNHPAVSANVKNGGKEKRK